ncbi:hypothetical protein CB1_000544024 [Camelus ferus]|nr:hypothetical protein CB1_000544024 [Camelus ferus]
MPPLRPPPSAHASPPTRTTVRRMRLPGHSPPTHQPRMSHAAGRVPIWALGGPAKLKELYTREVCEESPFRGSSGPHFPVLLVEELSLTVARSPCWNQPSTQPLGAASSEETLLLHCDYHTILELLDYVSLVDIKANIC